MTMLRRLGSGRPRDSQVLRPMMMGWPLVVSLKCFRSSGRCQGSAPRPSSLVQPMMPLRAMATMSASCGWICDADSAMGTLCPVDEAPGRGIQCGFVGIAVEHGKDARGQLVAQLDTPLFKGVAAPDDALDEDFMFVERE